MANSTLYIDVFDQNFQRIDAAQISIYQNQVLVSQQFSQLNESSIFVLDAKLKEYSFDSYFPEPYISYDIFVEKNGYQAENRYDIRIFEDISSTLEIVMVENHA